MTRCMTSVFLVRTMMGVGEDVSNNNNNSIIIVIHVDARSDYEVEADVDE